MWTRLWKEAEDSIDTAEWLTKQISVKVEIDMDYNGDENFKSHKLISAAKGWANSLGYKVNITLGAGDIANEVEHIKKDLEYAI